MNSVLQPDLDHQPSGSESRPPGGDTAAADWCRWQARLLPQTEQLVVFRVRQTHHGYTVETGADTSTDDPLACWPEGQPIDHLIPLVGRALNDLRCLSAQITLMPVQQAATCIAIPLPEKEPTHVVVVTTLDTSETATQAIRRLVEWGAYWLRSEYSQLTSASTQHLVRAVMQHDSLPGAVQEVVDQVASRVAAERVSFGMALESGARTLAVSNNPAFDRRMKNLVAIERAMDEALDQETQVSSRPDEGMLQRQHLALCAQSGSAFTLSIPLAGKDQMLGVLTVECDQELSVEHGRWLTEVTQELAPVLNLLVRENQTLTQRLVTFWRGKWVRLTGREHSGRQFWAMALTVFFLCSIVFEGPHRIAARASIEGSDRQVITAAHAGFIQSAAVRAGETVEQNQVLARLDDRELLLTQQQWHTELDKLEKSYAQALATGNRTELSLLRAQRDEFQAELKLVLQQLERNVIRAPFDGVLISGDLNQQLGAPVEAGQTLFEITSLESYRLLLDVDEHSIADVQSGQKGTLRLASMPDNSYDLSVLRVMPVAQSKNGRTVFRMQAELSEDDPRLRPGMQGVAKIDIGHSSWLWLWTHRFVHHARLWLWSIGV